MVTAFAYIPKVLLKEQSVYMLGEEQSLLQGVATTTENQTISSAF